MKRVNVQVGRGVSQGVVSVTAFLLVSLVLVGCSTLSPSPLLPPVGANPNMENVALHSSAASKELAAARRQFQAGDYSHVIPRLQDIAAKYPKAAAGIEANYWLGLTYYNINGLDNATKYFQAYLDADPDGEFAEDSQTYLDGMTTNVEQRLVNGKPLGDLIVEVRQKAEEEPGELALQLQLADLYWMNAQYEESGLIYQQVLARWPELEKDSTIRNRMDKNTAGVWVVLTPNEVLLREAERDPLVIFNTNSFRSGRYSGRNRTGLNNRYNVSGQLMNRGSEALSNVRVQVTIFDIQNVVYEVKTVGLGTLRPGDSRAFSVQFSQFDTIENVQRYACVAFYD